MLRMGHNCIHQEQPAREGPKIMAANTWTITEQAEIIRDTAEILVHVSHVQAHMDATGTVVPMRTLGHWEEMRLDQHDLLMVELRPAREFVTQWDYFGL